MKKVEYVTSIFAFYLLLSSCHNTYIGIDNNSASKSDDNISLGYWYTKDTVCIWWFREDSVLFVDKNVWYSYITDQNKIQIHLDDDSEIRAIVQNVENGYMIANCHLIVNLDTIKLDTDTLYRKREGFSLPK